jgi:hypothetical protein
MLSGNELLLELNKSISEYSKVYTDTPSDVSVLEALDKIKSGRFSSQIARARSFLAQNDVQHYREFKVGLPGVCFSGKFFRDRTRTPDVYSGFIVIDVDHINPDEVMQLRSRFDRDTFILSSWISPSGQGVKALVLTDSTPELHKVYFESLRHYFGETHETSIDICGADATRFCFYSSDPTLTVKDECEMYRLSDDEITERLLLMTGKSLSRHSPNLKASLSLSEQGLLHDRTGRNSISDIRNMRKIINFLAKKSRSITRSYEDWYKVGLAIANTFTYDIGKPLFISLCRIDGPSHDEQRSSQMIRYLYLHRRMNEVNFASIRIRAEKQGFVFRAREIGRR